MEPFGEQRADLRMAINTSVLAEVNRDRKRRPKPYTPSDFMPKFGKGAGQSQRVPITTQEQWQKVKAKMKLVAGKPANEDAA